MADIAAADVAYTLQSGTAKTEGDSRQGAVYKIVFGDGALTYPSGGVPLTKGNLGLPTVIEEFFIMDSNDANGLIYKYDYENAKLRIYTGDNDETADGPLVEVSGALAATTLYVKAIGW